MVTSVWHVIEWMKSGLIIVTVVDSFRSIFFGRIYVVQFYFVPCSASFKCCSLFRVVGMKHFDTSSDVEPVTIWIQFARLPVSDPLLSPSPSAQRVQHLSRHSSKSSVRVTTTRVLILNDRRSCLLWISSTMTTLRLKHETILKFLGGATEFNGCKEIRSIFCREATATK